MKSKGYRVALVTDDDVKRQIPCELQNLPVCSLDNFKPEGSYQFVVKGESILYFCEWIRKYKKFVKYNNILIHVDSPAAFIKCNDIKNLLSSKGVGEGLLNNLLKNKAVFNLGKKNDLWDNFSNGNEVITISRIYNVKKVIHENQPNTDSVEADSEKNLAWYGTISGPTFYAFVNFLNCIALEKFSVTVHVISESALQERSRLDLSRYAPQIRFIFLPRQKDASKCLNYIQHNCDAVITYGEKAALCLANKLRVIIPTLLFKKEIFNHYALACECPVSDEYTLTISSVKDVKTYPLVDALNANVQANDFDCYLKESNNLALNNFINIISTSTFTIQDLLEITEIRSVLAKYERYHSLVSYDKFHKFFLLPDIKSQIKAVLKFILKNIRFSIKKKLNVVPSVHQIRAYLHYKLVEHELKKKEKLKVAFLVVFNSVFPVRPVFEKMLGLEKYDPYLLVIPNVSRGHEYQMQVYKEALDSLSKQYPGRVIGAYDETNDRYLDLGDQYQILFFCNPYPKLVNRLHSIDYFLHKKVLTVYQNYGFAALSFWDNVISSDFFNKTWLCCIESPENYKYLRIHGRMHALNATVTGYIKMDQLAQITVGAKQRKTVILAPHHTVWGWETLNIGNFLKYYDFFLQLPMLFKDLDFVFRPHPLLFPNLIAHKIWTSEQISEYLKKIELIPNMVYEPEGDYMELFARSSAIIHDCGSFIGEYLYTKNPCCYMIKSQELCYDSLLPFGKMCMDQYYKATSEEDIRRFIQDVVIDEIDVMKEQRNKFVETHLKINYPNASDALIKLINERLKLGA